MDPATQNIHNLLVLNNHPGDRSSILELEDVGPLLISKESAGFGWGWGRGGGGGECLDNPSFINALTS